MSLKKKFIFLANLIGQIMATIMIRTQRVILEELMKERNHKSILKGHKKEILSIPVNSKLCSVLDEIIMASSMISILLLSSLN